MNYCKSEKIGAKECGKMWNRVRRIEEGRIPAKEARGWKIEGQKIRITRKEDWRLRMNLRLEVSWLKKEQKFCQEEKFGRQRSLT